MTPKLIALDLDETILDRDSRLSPAGRAALSRAIDRGIQIVVATGRHIDTIPAEIRAFPGIRYAITGNGAAIYDLVTGEIMLHRTLPDGVAAQVFSLTAGENLTYEAFVAGAAYAQADYVENPALYMADAQTQAYVQSTRRPVADIRAFALKHQTELDSLDLVMYDLDAKDRIMEQLKILNCVYITTSVPRLVEISHMDCGKHRGLQFLAEHLGIAQEETAAFGNADNDAEMLEWAGIGVAVGNASEGCRASADYITAPYWEDGVARAFFELFGI